MATCNKCGRPLQADEKNLCPACRSARSGKIKRALEITGSVVLVVGAVVYTIVFRRPPPWRRA